MGVNNTKTLSLIIDENLTWNSHITKISKTISVYINTLKRIKLFIAITTAIKIYKSLIELHFKYHSSVWNGISCKLNDKLQKLQNREARVTAKSVMKLHQILCSKNSTGRTSYQEHVRSIELYFNV